MKRSTWQRMPGATACVSPPGQPMGRPWSYSARSASTAGAELRHFAVGQAVHIGAALDEHRRAIAVAFARYVVGFVLVDHLGLAGAGVVGQLPGQRAFADDDALVAGCTVDDEIAERIGVDAVMMAHAGLSRQR